MVGALGWAQLALIAMGIMMVMGILTIVIEKAGGYPLHMGEETFLLETIVILMFVILETIAVGQGCTVIQLVYLNISYFVLFLIYLMFEVVYDNYRW